MMKELLGFHACGNTGSHVRCAAEGKSTRDGRFMPDEEARELLSDGLGDSIRPMTCQMESFDEIVKRRSGNNSELIEEDLVPIDETIPGDQVGLPLIYQAEIPNDKEEGEGNHAERGRARVSPEPGSTGKQRSQAKGEDRG